MNMIRTHRKSMAAFLLAISCFGAVPVTQLRADKADDFLKKLLQEAISNSKPKEGVLTRLYRNYGSPGAEVLKRYLGTKERAIPAGIAAVAVLYIAWKKWNRSYGPDRLSPEQKLYIISKFSYRYVRTTAPAYTELLLMLSFMLKSSPGSRRSEALNLLAQLLITFRGYKRIQELMDTTANFYKILCLQLSNSRVTFDDVAGATEAKEACGRIVQFLKNPKWFQKFGARLPRGILLIGEPGNGKTLLAKAVATEANATFIAITASEMHNMFLGASAEKVRTLFSNARKNAPTVIFIDEFDSLAPKRDDSHSEHRNTLNQLLAEMDGFGTGDGIVVIAATNNPDLLDKAAVRPGRFDTQVTVDKPTQENRVEILRIHIRRRNVPVDTAVDLDAIAQQTDGMCGAALEAIVNEAALNAASNSNGKGAPLVKKEDFDHAIHVVQGNTTNKLPESVQHIYT